MKSTSNFDGTSSIFRLTPTPNLELESMYIESRHRVFREFTNASDGVFIVGEESGCNIGLLNKSNGERLSVSVSGERDSHYNNDFHDLGKQFPLDVPWFRVKYDNDFNRHDYSPDEGLSIIKDHISRLPSVVSWRIIVSTLQRGIATCMFDNKWRHDHQVRNRIHVEIDTVNGGNGEDAISVDSLTMLSSPSVVSPLLNRAFRRANMSVAKIEAPTGRMPVVFSEGSSGVLFHELVGHLLESDIVMSGGTLLSSRMGEQVCVDSLTITDDPTLVGYWGSFRIDDEGRTSVPTPLIQNGKICGVLSNTELQGTVKNATYEGNSGRRSDYNSPPLPRMSNLMVDAGSDNLSNVQVKIKYGIYCDGITRGSVNPKTGQFTLNLTSGRLIRDGHLAEPISNAYILGNVLDALSNIEFVCNDLDDVQTVCGKSGQQVLVGMVSPSVMISDVLVVGR